MTDAGPGRANASGERCGIGAASTVQLGALFEREQYAMVRLAALLVGSRALAEEIVQESFITVGARWANLDNPGGYLRSTVVNACRMALRRRAIERRYAHDAASVVDTPTELVELHDALARLSDRQRAVVVLRYFADASDAEVAQLLGCRTSTVRSLARRSLLKLRKELS